MSTLSVSHQEESSNSRSDEPDTFAENVNDKKMYQINPTLMFGMVGIIAPPAP